MTRRRVSWPLRIVDTCVLLVMWSLVVGASAAFAGAVMLVMLVPGDVVAFLVLCGCLLGLGGLLWMAVVASRTVWESWRRPPR